MSLQSGNKFDLATDLILNTKCNVFLTGKAGTGKTTFLKGLLQECTDKRVVVAPTGIAAINANGVTMHSFFQLPFHPFLPDAPSMSSEVSDTNKEIIRELELLIIDEVSMVRADMLDAIDYRLRKVRQNSEPFGGVQLLLIGDLFQLPPVAVPEEYDMLKEHYDSLFFFASKALGQSDFVTVELDKIFRQDDKEFKDILNSIREGKASRYIIERLNKRYVPDFTPKKDEPYIRLVTHNAQAEKINREEMENLEGKKYTIEATVMGEFPETSYPVPYTLILKEGAHVMTTKNKSGEYSNGSLGIVTDVDVDGISVKLIDSGRIVKVEEETWDNIVYKLEDVAEKDERGKSTGKKKKVIVEECLGTFTHFPLRPAWAITIHKSQGLSFDRAIIDVSRSFMAGQTYVALSRCRSLQGLVLSEKVDFRAIKCDKTVKEFYKNEAERMPDIEKLDEMRREAYLKSIHSNLDVSVIDKELIYLCQLVAETDIDSTCIDSLFAAQRDFSLYCVLHSEDRMVSISAQINETKAYSQNVQIQKAISDLANSNLQSIKELESQLFSYEITSNLIIRGQVENLQLIESRCRIIWEYIIENGFNLLDITRFIKNNSPSKHEIKRFDGRLSMSGVDYITRVEITEIEGECREADWQECTIYATAFVKVEFQKKVDGKEQTLMACTFFAHTIYIEEFGDKNEWEIEDLIEEDNISDLVSELSIADFEGLEKLDFHAQGVPVNGEGLSAEDIGQAIAKALDDCGINWDCGEFQCTKIFSEDKPSGEFDK